MNVDTTTRWIPETPMEREMVLRELNAIVSSHHFRNSKRYPALLQYVVDKTLDGHSDQLKERTLGIEVFDRPPDYDTNADPVVRFSAAEVRKRIAQFYHENDSASRLRINLPLGSYVPEFRLRQEQPEEHAAEEREQQLHVAVGLVGTQIARAKPYRIAFNAYIGWLVILLIPVASVGAYVFHRTLAPTPMDLMWKPLLKSSGSVLLVTGNGPHGIDFSPNAAPVNLVPPASQSHGPYNHISFCEAVALSHLADLLGKHAKPYQIKEADLATLQDIRDRSVVFVGAYNNLWTMRLTEPLRFHFQKEGPLVWVVDTKNPENRDWAVDYTKPYSAALYDYAVVARYVDPTTNSGILIVAGIGAYGTQAASEVVASTQDLDKLLVGLPHGWENKNLEMVIKTAVINGEAGPPTLVSATTW